MMRKTAAVVVCVVLTLAAPALRAGGRLEQIDITGFAPSPIAGELIAKIVGIQWDARTIPVRYSMNTTLSPIPNPLGPAFLSVDAARAALQASFDQWNQIPTSYIDMQITGTTNNLGLAGFDMINELSFRTAAAFNAIAVSPSTSFILDVTLVNGDDIDEDGDSDVSSAITSAADVDGDGDIEFPPGFYKAGTIVDNDVQFNTKVSNGLRFTVADADADVVTRSVDLMCVAVHEFGHSLGLSHTMNNQKSASDGNGATMFPFIDTGDPAAELGGRSLDIDDIAWSAFVYPEGSAATGVAALQPGDRAFGAEFGLIKGSVRHGLLNQPIAAASVLANVHNTGAASVSAYSGTTQVSFNPATGGLSVISAAFNILNGDYTIPVPKGSYEVSVEPIDGFPAAAANISLAAQIGVILGQHNFNEEFWSKNQEGVPERRPGDEKTVSVSSGQTRSGIDIVTNDSTLNVNNFRARAASGFISPPAGSNFTYALRVPASQIAEINPGGAILVTAASFDTNVFDSSVAPRFADAILTTGTVNPDGSINTIALDAPLAHASGFLAQENDFSPFYFQDPKELGQIVRQGVADGSIQNLFLVLRAGPAPYPGVSGQPPLVGFSTATPILGFSYLSLDGGLTFTRQTARDFRFSLLVTKPAQ
jgi:hypothetical protein